MQPPACSIRQSDDFLRYGGFTRPDRDAAVAFASLILCPVGVTDVAVTLLRLVREGVDWGGGSITTPKQGGLVAEGSIAYWAKLNLEPHLEARLQIQLSHGSSRH